MLEWERGLKLELQIQSWLYIGNAIAYSLCFNHFVSTEISM